MDGKIKRFARIYPWYSGLTGDLLFYIAIDTLFLTLVKHFSAAQIVSLTSLSQLACIALQFPLLFVIKKIGNTASLRLGALLLLLSAICITLGQSYYVVLESTPKEQHQTLLTVLEFGVKIAGAGMGLVFSAILVGYPMAVVMWLLLGISATEIALSLKLFKAVRMKNKRS